MAAMRWARTGAGALALVLAVLALGPGEARAQATGAVRDSLTIEEAVEAALERNRELSDANLALDAAEAQVREAWGSVFPQVSVDASYTRNISVPSNFLPATIFDPAADPDELVPVRFGADNIWGFRVRMEQPLFQAQAFVGVGAAARYRRLQRESVRGTAEAVATRVRLAYYDVLLARDRVRLTENSVDRIRETLEETRSLHAAGLASEYDVLRLEVQLANLEPDLRRARNDAAAARRRLAIGLGRDADAPVAVRGDLAGIELDGEGSRGGEAALRLVGLRRPEARSAGEVVEEALARRSDLRQLDLTEALRTAEIRAEQAGMLPTVSLFGTYSIDAQENGPADFFGGPDDPRSYGRQIGVQVSVPIFTGFQRSARVGQKRAERRRVRMQYEQARAQAENEIRTLLDRVAEARARAEAQRRTVEQARRGFEIAGARFREGVGGRLDVTEAEVALRRSEFNHAEAVYDYLVARARLDRAAGRVPLVDTDENGRIEPSRTTEP